MQDYAKTFYKSKTWQQCRNAFAKSKGNLCEECLAVGKYTPGEIVHHIVPITSNNINNPNITLDWNNLRLVCRKCHGEEHSNKNTRRYVVDADGSVRIIDSPPC